MKSLKLNASLNILQNITKVIFPLITIPYASRVLGATNNGKVSFGNSIVRYFILIAALGVATYAQREAPGFRDNKNRISCFSNQVFSINVYASLVSYAALAVLLLFSNKLKDYTLLILIQSSAVILNTLGADWINVVYEDYLFITIRYVAMQCVALILMFLFVKSPSDYYIFAMINVLATAGGNLFNIFYIKRYVNLRLVSPKECVQHLRPIFLLFCVSVTTIIYISSDITILGYIKTDEDVGIYSLASNIYSVVKQVISAVIVVSIPRMSYYLGNDMNASYEDLAKKVLGSLMTMLLPAIAGLAFLSYDILNVMGGTEYLRGQGALVVLSVALFFAILAGFYANGYLLIVKKDNFYLLATTVSAVVNIGLNVLFIPKWGIVGAAMTTVLAEMTMAVMAFTQARKNYKFSVCGRVVVTSGVGAVMVTVICRAVCLFEVGSVIRIGISFIVSLAIYYMVLKVGKNPFVDAVDVMLKKVVDFGWKK